MQTLDTKTTCLHHLLGTLATVWLYGATCIQVHQYYNNVGSDRFLLKFSVGFIFALETAHVALCSYFYYVATIENYGALTFDARSAVVSFYIGVVIAWIVNLFFIYRIYILSKKNLWLSVVVSIVATIRPTFGFVIVILAIIFRSVPFGEHARWIMTTSVAFEVLVDGLIAICISYFLLRGRNKLIVSTCGIINRLLMSTLHTGIILMIFASFELLEVVHWPYTSAATLAIFHIQVQLYANCFLTMLNARHEIRHAMENGPVVTFSNMSSQPVAGREV
jgi:hypothetical protein